jgi:hypothetical protein
MEPKILTQAEVDILSIRLNVPIPSAHIIPFVIALEGATSAPKASREKGFTQQGLAPNTELIDNEMDRGRKERRRCTQCMVEKDGLMRENKTAIKNATDILSSAATKVSKSVSTNYIETVSLVTQAKSQICVSPKARYNLSSKSTKI